MSRIHLDCPHSDFAEPPVAAEVHLRREPDEEEEEEEEDDDKQEDDDDNAADEGYSE